MADADRIRDGIRAAVARREAGQREFDEGTTELRLWLRKAKDADGLPMAEAARLAGVARVSAYEMADAAD
jgi:hypothetical protein